MKHSPYLGRVQRTLIVPIGELATQSGALFETMMAQGQGPVGGTAVVPLLESEPDGLSRVIAAGLTRISPPDLGARLAQTGWQLDETTSVRLLLLIAVEPETGDTILEYVQLIAGQVEAPDFIAEVHAEMKRRSDEGSAGDPPIFLLVHGLQKFRKLRYEEDFSFGGDDSPKPSNQLNEIINEGPPLGIHLITSLDTLINIQRCLSRKALSELGMRVLFQMSANDSATGPGFMPSNDAAPCSSVFDVAPAHRHRVRPRAGCRSRAPSP